MAVKKSELYSLLWEAANKLRGGVEPSRYKDYVLLLLFFKYVSDRYKDQRYGEFEISEGSSFEDLILAKGKPDVGERVDKIIQKFLETNNLKGALPDVSFNNPDELGKGKELVDKVYGLIAIFQNPAIDFKKNRASGDDIIGDAYEYFMMKFAQESGKSKGQFYTPSEVSRAISRLIGIGEIKNTLDKKWTLHDPAAGSGSLLIRAADEAPVDSNGDSIVTIYGQEKYPDTAGLAKMNFILHNKGTGEIHSDNTLSMPYYTDDFGELRKFDFIVMNPPFSDKDWSDGIKADKDIYHRFDGYGIPPEKNGDYAWFLHVLKALNENGKAGIILPHGVLFRGNAEETIRKEILKRKYIKGIVGLPSNLFYGTGIPACIIIIDKENADKREGLFMIDASDGYKKDGDKNRLREQDIERIVQVFTNKIEIKGYSRFITYKEIIEEHDGNLNVPRYIKKIDNTLPQNISAHLNGGIPMEDVDSVFKLWNISNELKGEIFVQRKDSNVYDLKVNTDNIEALILEDKKIQEEIDRESKEIFKSWKNSIEDKLKNIDKQVEPKIFIRELGFSILKYYEDAKLLDNYDVYDFLLNYWNEKLQDDIYIIKASGYEAGLEIEREYGKKKIKDEQGVEIEIDDKNKFKSFDGLLIPKTIIEKEYFKDKLDEIENINLEISELDEKMNEIFEENTGDDGLLVEVLNDKGDSITKTNLNNRLKELESKKVSKDVESLTQMLEVFDAKAQEQMEEIFKSSSSLANYELRNANGKFGKGKIDKSLKLAQESAKIPEVYKDEYEILTSYKDLMDKKDERVKAQKDMIKALDKKVVEKYGELSLEEIKELLLNKKWMARINSDIKDAVDNEINNLASRLVDISKRYENTLSELEEETDKSRVEVKKALERMGYSW
ncbi:N-6 DNA methylase [Campylobacter hominis]|uniref:N-6 DNA methylase n=1 Tax=Campylobacter hominis TaxID=76517 RepID=UPI00248C6991|nr:N-6 DNA methylase [Campylobacter hominis]